MDRVTTRMSRTNVLETAGGTISILERWPRRDRNRGPPDLPDNFRSSTRVERCLDSLNVLQSQRTQFLYDHTLAVPLQFLHDSLPYMVQHDVNILKPVKSAIWATPLINLPDGQWELEELLDEYQPSLRTKRYHFWPIDVSARADVRGPTTWVLIVLYLTPRDPDVDDPDSPDSASPAAPYRFLDTYAVIDPNHGNASRDLEDGIARLLLDVLPLLGITVGPGATRAYPWVPPMNAPQVTPNGRRETWSSGLRVFEMIRVWLDRITESYCHNPHTHDRATFWDAHPGWFNVDAVRSNMIGMAATMVNRAMEGTTRIAIEPILDIAMRNNINGQAYRTKTTLPVSRRLGAFVPDESRRRPVCLRDRPNDGNNVEVAMETGGEDSEDSDGDGGE